MKKTHRNKTAVLGGGISGYSFCHFLEENEELDLHLFEAKPSLGGHAFSVDVKTSPSQTVQINPIVHVFVKPIYKHFNIWLNQLEVETDAFDFGHFVNNESTGSSFKVTSDLVSSYSIKREINNLYGKVVTRNIFKEFKSLSDSGSISDETPISSVIRSSRLAPQPFLENIFYPWMSFAFHGSTENTATFPCKYFFERYYDAIGQSRSSYCIRGGTETYVRKVVQSLRRTRLHLNCQIQTIRREKEKWVISDSNDQEYVFDDIVFAMWPLQIVEILRRSLHFFENETDALSTHLKEIYRILNSIEHVHCKARVHSDKALMPHNQKDWTTYSYLTSKFHPHTIATKWSGQVSNTPVFTTYDWSQSPDFLEAEEKLAVIKGKPYFSHSHVRTPPRVSLYRARNRITQIQGNYRLWFTGAFMRSTGYHEDALVQSLSLIPSFRGSSKLQRLDELQRGLISNPFLHL